jgi:hypothetical protein
MSGKRELNRRNWVEQYNNSLPQKKWFDEEFQIEMSMGIGGIYDSEYMEYIFNNKDIYGRIKKIKRQLKKDLKNDIKQ